MPPARGSGGGGTRGDQLWLDLLKAFAIVWIFVNHVVEPLFGSPLIGNPTADWPPLADRLAQLEPRGLAGLTGAIWEVVRYIGWTGDVGVQLFLVASGFGLGWSLMRRAEAGAPPPIDDRRDFPWRRTARLYPLWWAAHLVFIAVRVPTGVGTSPFEPDFYLSFAGLRFLPRTFYYGAPAWWYVGLQLQLYLVFPLIWRALRRHGPLKMLLGVCAVAFAARALGFLVFDAYLDHWLRGGIFITRLPEFAFGAALAVWLAREPERVGRLLGRAWMVALGVGVFAAGMAMSLTAAGNVFAPLLTGIGLVPAIYAISERVVRRLPPLARAGRWTGRRSYGIYLVHHPILMLLLVNGESLRFAAVVVPVAAVLTLAGTVGLERLTAWGQARFNTWRARRGLLRALVRSGLYCGAAFAAVLGCTLAADHAVRVLDPQETLGWGERAALVPDADVGWRLAPSRTTRLRWIGYDYTVHSNALGFPGPEPPSARAVGSLRVMTLGDAFTSAEGVDTADAWPRRLERHLAPEHAEVINFGVTGHGPNQYAAVAEKFVPTLRPDVVAVGFFINDFEDTGLTEAQFHESIGFAMPPQGSRYERLRGLQLRAWVQNQLWLPLHQRITGELHTHSAFFSGARFLQPGPDYAPDRLAAVEQQLGRVAAAARGVGARPILVVVPSPLQVCAVEDLPYLAGWSDVDALDPDLPQRHARAIAERLAMPYYDLRPALRGVRPCPFQPHNLHLLPSGHEAIAAALAEGWIRDGVVAR